MALSYDAVGVSVLASPVTSPRERAESEFYYTLAFPATRALHSSSSSSSSLRERVSYQHAATLLRAATAGGKEHERRAVDELQRAWECKFRSARPAPQDSVTVSAFQELLREMVVQRFDAIPGLFFTTRASADGRLLLLSLRPSKALLAATADALRLRVPTAPELDPGESYWAADSRRCERERDLLDKAEAQEELYRLFLAGKLSADETQLFEGESAAMWSRRLRALGRFSDPEVTRHLATPPPVAHVPFKNHPALQYVYRQIDSAAAFTASGSSPFRVVDKIRLTKAIVDAEFDCDALVAQRVLAHHFCTHTHHTDAVDTSVDVLRFQWGSLLSPWRVYRQRLAHALQLLYFQPLVHVRNYFGEEIALYFAYTSFYAQWLQYLCAVVLLLVLLQSWVLGTDKETRGSDAAEHVKAIFATVFCLLNCSFVQLFVRKWAMRERELASDWGVSELKSSLQTRPQFRGEMERSPINLRLEPHYPPAKRTVKCLASSVVLLLLCAAILFGYYSLLTARVFESALRGSQLGLQGSNVLLAVVTKCVGVPLVHVSKRLNDWENYKTQTDYDANFTLKFALLQTVNSFGMLWYMTFLRPFLTRDACNEAVLQLSCRDQAAALLLAMLALDFTLTLVELRAPFYALLCSRAHERVRGFFAARRRRLRKEEASRRTFFGSQDASSRHPLLKKSSRIPRAGTAAVDAGDSSISTAHDDEDESESPIDIELALEPYEGVMLDYAQVVVSLGFVTWFAALSPTAAFLAWGIAVLQIRVDTFKLSNLTQRPFPVQKNSIGSWLLYLRFLSLMSMLHNAAFAWMFWVERLSPPPQRITHLHDLLELKTGPQDAQLLLASEKRALAIFSTFALVWFVIGLPDQSDRATAKLLWRARQRERFLENKFVNNVERVSDAVKDSLPPGRVFLNGVHRYVVTGNKAEEDAADEIFDELRGHQLRVLDVEKRIADLRHENTSVGVLFVEVVRINILPAMDALTKAVDSFVQLKLQTRADASEDAPGPRATTVPSPSVRGVKPANTSVAKKNRSPQWLEKFEFPLTSLDDVLELSVWDWELLGKNRRIGRASLLISDVISRTFVAEPESPRSRTRQTSTATATASTATATVATAEENAVAPARARASLITLVMGSFELPIEMPEELLNSMAAADLVRHGYPRLQLRCGVQLQELGALLVRRLRLRKAIEDLKERETRFVQWPELIQ